MLEEEATTHSAAPSHRLCTGFAAAGRTSFTGASPGFDATAGLVRISTPHTSNKLADMYMTSKLLLCSCGLTPLHIATLQMLIMCMYPTWRSLLHPTFSGSEPAGIGATNI